LSSQTTIGAVTRTEMESQRRALSVRTAGSANTTLSIMRGGANTWAECRPNRIGIQPAGKIFLLTFPFIGHVHAHHAQRGATPFPQLLGEELFYRFLGPVLAHPQKHSSFQIVDHGQINLAFSSTHFIDADPVYRRPLAMAQAITHCPLYDSGHRLPVQTKMPRRSLPTQLPAQAGHRIGQCSGESRPRQPTENPPPARHSAGSAPDAVGSAGSNPTFASTNPATPAFF